MAELTADLAYWISERHSILLRRRAGMPPPWSPDPIFQTVRFCNVRREDDAVTKWIRENWNGPNDPAWKFVLGRMINLPTSLAQILTGWNQHPYEDPLGRAKLDLQIERVLGKKIFTSAYTISTCGKKMDKLDYVFNLIEDVKKLEESGARPWVDRSKLCQDTWEVLQRVDGLGSFLAAQVVADMKNTEVHPLSTAEDWWTFSAPGPGSLRGLSWWRHPELMILGRQEISAKHYAGALADCRAAVDPLIAHVPKISDQDFQNCLCEFSKYCKVKYLNGHVRNRYVPNYPS